MNLINILKRSISPSTAKATQDAQSYSQESKRYFEEFARNRGQTFKVIHHLWQKHRFPWYDHRLDELNWPNNLFWIERGILARRLIKEGDKVLDLCCGDGYYAKYLYSTVPNVEIDALDNDPKVLALARSFNVPKNVAFHLQDLLGDSFPQKRYDCVFWFEGIEHISQEDCEKVFEKIKHCSEPKKTFTLFGSTPIVENLGRSNWQHCNEFTSKSSLERFLRKSFSKVEVWTSTYPEGKGKRTTAYFLINT